MTAPVVPLAPLLFGAQPANAGEDTAREALVQMVCNDDAEAQASRWDLATDKRRALAIAQATSVERSLQLVAVHGLSQGAADEQAGREMRPRRSKRSVEGYRERTVGQGVPQHAWAQALLAKPKSGRPPKDVWKRAGAAALADFFDTDYLREEAPTAEAVHRRLAGIAKHKRWELPPLVAFMARLHREYTPHEIARARGGVKGAMALVPAQERTVADMAVNDLWSGDGREWDDIVLWPDGTAARPRVWEWQDVRSRRILAWRVGQVENSELVRLALYDGIIKVGVPKAVQVDWTLAARAKDLTSGLQLSLGKPPDPDEPPGLLKLLSIGFHLTAVDRDAAGRGIGRGRSKPVERTFLSQSFDLDSHPSFTGAGTGRSPSTRPETHRLRAIPLAEFEQRLRDCVLEYNARPRRRTEMAKGKLSFDAVWQEGVRQAVIRRISERQAAILLTVHEEVTIAGDGSFRLRLSTGPDGTNRYASDRLLRWDGKTLTARIDPQGLYGPAHLWDRDGRWVCEAPCVAKTGFGDTAAAGAHQRRLRKVSRMTDKLQAARDRLPEYLRALDEVPAPEEPPEPEPMAVQIVGGLPELPPRHSAPASPAAKHEPPPDTTRRRFFAALKDTSEES